MLPILGAWLFLLPVLWPATENAPPTSRVLVYVFLAWAGLVALGGLLTWAQRRLAAQVGIDDDDA